MSNISNMSSTSTNEKMFFNVQQKTDKEHILENPDTYIGSVEEIDNNMYVMSNDKIIEKNIKYVPALFKLFDEGIVNCRDHAIRMKSKITENVPNSIPVSYIDISIQEDGLITMVNDGNGIDIVKHADNNVWIPELIFGHLRTSTNYNKNEKKNSRWKKWFWF